MQEKLTLLLKSTVRSSTLYPLCQFETLYRSVSMRGSRVKVGSVQRARSAPPVELRQSSGAHGRCNNSAHWGGGLSLKQEVGGERAVRRVPAAHCTCTTAERALLQVNLKLEVSFLYFHSYVGLATQSKLIILNIAVVKQHISIIVFV